MQKGRFGGNLGGGQGGYGENRVGCTITGGEIDVGKMNPASG